VTIASPSCPSGSAPARPPTDPTLADLYHRAPELYALLDPARLDVDEAPQLTDFEDALVGGRGESYRHAQRDPTVRLHGIRQLFALASPAGTLESWRPEHVLVDLLGGDGTLARAVERVTSPASRPAVLTSDMSAGMIRAAQRRGLPAVRQAAQRLRLRDGSVDAVLMAYGTHHIPPADRPAAFSEAHRVLRPGGAVVSHDFAEGSPTARWFGEVVHPYSHTGHDYPHFTEEEVRRLLSGAGFARIRVERMYDPLVLTAPTQDQARLRLGDHLRWMYGLTRLPGGDEVHAARRAAEFAEATFDYPPADRAPGQEIGQVSYRETGHGWTAELPRVALVGVGRRAG
jgi:ubiquinone/menaquinone biosynthesis C-methylase UbiE